MDNIKPEIIEGEAVLRSLPEIEAFSLIGSAMYLPAEQCHDVDFAVLTKDGVDAMGYLNRLAFDGWDHCGEEYDTQHGTWGAVRRGNLNLMVTHDRAWYERYLTAMQVCKVLKLTNKEDRIAVCRVVRDGLTADEVRPPIPQMPESMRKELCA
jgi:hypothetical protein